VLAVKVAYDKAAGKAGGFPSQDQVIEAFRGMEFESFSTTVKMALAGGHQAVTENGYGITKYDETTGEVTMTDVKFYPAECVNPPEGVTAVEWIEGGMKGAKCD
jgi:branched-chain amino acid transport system substrate-binding protein